MKTSKFIYDGTERNVLVIEETDGDIFGYDLNLLTDEMKEKLKTSFRHFKKDKIETYDIIKKSEVVKKREA